jgi:hypothetical protein
MTIAEIAQEAQEQGQDPWKLLAQAVAEVSAELR